jgi:protein-S-isoprenylcysteine O-methyltransferase Ste14
MKKLSPPTLTLIFLLGMIVLHFLFPLTLFSNWWFIFFGIASIIFSLIIAFGAEAQFRKRDTTVHHLGTATKLVSDGWFQYSRNPMYLSLLLLLVGAWLLLGSLSPFFLIPVFILLVNQWYIVHEERRMLAAFGNDYTAYQRRTRRWI